MVRRETAQAGPASDARGKPTAPPGAAEAGRGGAVAGYAALREEGAVGADQRAPEPVAGVRSRGMVIP